MKPVCCFIDDAHFELDNFRDNAQEAFARVEMVYARTFEQARISLMDKRPICFLLDLYGSQPEAGPGQLPDMDDLSSELEKAFSRKELYQGLTSGDPEAGNQFLRRMHSRLHLWQDAFAQSCQALGQGVSYGLDNLTQVRKHYPWAAALGYSRKALYKDAVEFIQAGGDGLLQKPQGEDDEAVARATRHEAPELAQACYSAVDRRLSCQVSRLILTLQSQGRCLPLAEVLAPLAIGLGQEESLEENQGNGDQIREHLHVCDLEQEELDLVWALRDWLVSLT